MCVCGVSSLFIFDIVKENLELMNVFTESCEVAVKNIWFEKPTISLFVLQMLFAVFLIACSENKVLGAKDEKIHNIYLAKAFVNNPFGLIQMGYSHWKFLKYFIYTGFVANGVIIGAA